MQRFFSKKITFKDLVGWQNETFEGIFRAFHTSLEVFLRNPSSCDPCIRDSLQDIAMIFFNAPSKTPHELKAFFETFFDPFCSPDKTEGFYTAYYEIPLQGSYTKSDRYHVPLYRTPSNPHYTREEIMKGALKETPFLWLDDTIAAFFLHIQGSGLIFLENGDVIRIGYTTSNGYPYVSLGQALKESKRISEGALTKESLEGYLRTLPLSVLHETLALNPRYIFFEEIKGLSFEDGPRGTQGKPEQGVSLTSLRSIAVDPLYVPLGLPVWVQIFNLSDDIRPLFPRLMMAQDTGSAIKGPKRGDIFWGSGDEAGKFAGEIKNLGDMIVFWPKEKHLSKI